MRSPARFGVALIVGITAFKILGRSGETANRPSQPISKATGTAGPATVLVIIWVVLFTFTEDVAQALEESYSISTWNWVAWAARLLGIPDGQNWRVVAIALDVVLIVVSMLPKWCITRRERSAGVTPGWLTRWGWWLLGAALIVAIHLVLICGNSGSAGGLGAELAAAAAFLVAMALLLISCLNGDPLTLLWPPRRRQREQGWARAHSVAPARRHLHRLCGFYSVVPRLRWHLLESEARVLRSNGASHPGLVDCAVHTTRIHTPGFG
jgi:hypothetical protein